MAKTDGTLHIGRQALRDQLYATDQYEGITGQLSCDPFGDLGTGTYPITQFEDPSAGVEGLRTNIIHRYQSSDE